MRYDKYDDKIKFNSGYESVGFESFDRDDCMCFAANCASIDALESAKAYADCVSTVSSWSPQGTTSTSYITDSIAALESSFNNVKVDAETVGKALKQLASKLGYKVNDDWTIGLDLKNQFSRGNRLTRSQLLTI